VVKIKEFKTNKGTWLREEDKEGRTIREFFIVKKEVKKAKKLPDYEELAKEGEPLPEKYYKWKSKQKTTFVLQRHWPTGRKERIKPGEKPEEMHKGLGLLEECSNEIVQWLENSSLKKELFRIMKIRDHIDLRMEINGKLIGVTLHPPVPEGISSWGAFKERLKPAQRTQATPKHVHPKEWLTREGELRFPTRHTEPPEEKEVARYIEIARMEILDKGEVKYGVQRKDLHEYFFYGKELKGRFVLRKLKIGKEYKHWAWLFMKPEDQKPLDPVEHEDEGYWKIDWIKQPSPQAREDIEQEVARARAERKAEDWCSQAGGKWITDDGQHICVEITDWEKVPEKIRSRTRELAEQYAKKPKPKGYRIEGQKDEVETHIVESVLNRLPKEDLEGVKKISVVDEADVFSIGGERISADATFSKSTGEMRLERKYLTDPELNRVVFHEVAHSKWERLSSSDRREWENVYHRGIKMGYKFPSDYAYMKGAEEAFAECYGFHKSGRSKQVDGIFLKYLKRMTGEK